ncbi:MAG: coiled-coil domain-containing protein 22 [Eubacterium sp.]|nr:coiled-coil domain-containing protein 22 [Eubacterium sp.]
MIKKYLKHRKKLLENEIEKIEELSEMSQISIKQIDAQINNLKNEIDESSEMLSVSVRNNMSKKEDEVEDMEESKKETYDQIDKYAKEVVEKTKELKTINECLAQLDGINVSRETFKQTTLETQTSTQAERVVDQSLKTKLNFCKNLIGVDDVRAKIELEKLIKGL